MRIPLTAGLVAALAVSTSGMASAGPVSERHQDPRLQLAALQHQMVVATEAYDVARIDLAASQAKAAHLQQQIAAQEVKVQALHAEVDTIGAAAYRGGNLNTFNSLFTAGGPQSLLDQLSTLEHLSTDQREQINALLQAQRKLDADNKSVAAELAVQTKRAATLQANRAAIEADLKKAQRLAAAAAAAAPPRASRSRTTRAPSQFGPPAMGSGRGAIALRFAYSQMGKPYAWGASGPGSYDCSGLTMRSWAAAGVYLPHSSSRQYGSSPHISRSQLRPGDLVFFYSPISHVAIYAGGGMAIGAPHSGDVVRYQSISSMEYAGATRPG